jgi:serine/threonine-protein kinase
LLGSGGMGEVYEAHDPHLQRQVAVKVLSDERPHAVQRFIREARSQARVEHEHICQIFEVGESDGKPYIVMQLIKGRTLDQAVLEMSLEQKVVTMKRVAAAAHEAHRAGLIHRDIKPSNIMVEEAADGELKPYVMDFGIARSYSDPGMTTEGSFIGTPAYSAPEQVRGESSAIDRRTDVYSLGATLYAILAGAPPFSGPTPNVMMDVLEAAPSSLKMKKVPTDLETICMKCLEKEPDQRYRSARAVVDELQRYLDGEPILARPIGAGKRLLRKARRNRVTTAIVLVALTLVSLALVWGGYTRWRARVREQLVQDLTARVVGIESQVRYSHMSPRHDTRPDRELLQQEMAGIKEQIDRVGDIGEGPGHYALGRGHLALEELEAARHHLELAWSSGYSEPMVAYALGMTLSLQFRERLAEIQAIRDKDLREQSLQELQQELQQPALEYMNQSRGLDLQAQTYLRALIAFHQSHFGEALEHLAEVGTRYPWLYEYDKLEGDIYRQRGVARLETDAEGARQDLAKALQAYDRAQAIAESDPGIYLASGRIQLLMMKRDEFTDSDLIHYLDQGQQKVASALEVYPADERAFLLRAMLLQKMAEWKRKRQEDPVADLKEALVAATHAAELAPGSPQVFKTTGMIYSSWATWLATRRETEKQLEMIVKATNALQKVPDSARDSSFYDTLGAAYSSRGALHSGQGIDARPDYERAIAAYRRAVDLHPRPYQSSSNLGLNLRRLSSQPGVENRIGLLEEAVAAFERARDINPESPVPYYYLGLCFLGLAQEGDPFSGKLGEEVDKALEHYRQGQQINPKMAHFYSVIGEAIYLKAVQAWDRGGDPAELFKQAEEVYRQGIEVNPKFSYLHVNLGWNYYYRGKFLVREGKSPNGYLTRAINEGRQALELATHDGATLCIGSAYRMLAEHDLISGRNPEANLSRAEEAFVELLRRNPKHVSAYRSLGRLHTLEARWLASRRRDPLDAFSRAGQALEEALQLKPKAPTICLAEARRCLRMAGWLIAQNQPAESLLVRGLKYADVALDARNDWAEAMAVRACLQTLHSRSGAELGEHQTELERSLSLNPHLEYEWSPFLTQ